MHSDKLSHFFYTSIISTFSQLSNMYAWTELRSLIKITLGCHKSKNVSRHRLTKHAVGIYSKGLLVLLIPLLQSSECQVSSEDTAGGWHSDDSKGTWSFQTGEEKKIWSKLGYVISQLWQGVRYIWLCPDRGSVGTVFWAWVHSPKEQDFVQSTEFLMQYCMSFRVENSHWVIGHRSQVIWYCLNESQLAII